MANFEALPLSRNKIYQNGLYIDNDLHLVSDGKIWESEGYGPPISEDQEYYDLSSYVFYEHNNDDIIYVLGIRYKTKGKGYQPESNKILIKYLDTKTLTWYRFLKSGFPCSFVGGTAVLYNNKIHLFGGWQSSPYDPSYNIGESFHVAYDPSNETVTQMPDLLTPLYRGGAVVLSNGIHRIGGNPNNDYSLANLSHELFNGTTWTSIGDLPCKFKGNNTLVVSYNNKIYMFGNEASALGSHSYYVYTINEGWSLKSNIPNGGKVVCAFVYNGYLYVVKNENSEYTPYNYKAYRYNGTTWIEDETIGLKMFNSLVIDNPNYISQINSELYLFNKIQSGDQLKLDKMVL